MLIDAMKAHWSEIGFVPDNSIGYDIEEEESETVVQLESITNNKDNDKDICLMDGVYCGIKIVGLNAEENLNELYSVLLDLGLPEEKKVSDLLVFGRTVQIKDIQSMVCKNIVSNAHKKQPWSGKKTSVKLVAKLPSSDSDTDCTDSDVSDEENLLNTQVTSSKMVHMLKKPIPGSVFHSLSCHGLKRFVFKVPPLEFQPVRAWCL